MSIAVSVFLAEKACFLCGPMALSSPESWGPGDSRPLLLLPFLFKSVYTVISHVNRVACVFWAYIHCVASCHEGGHPKEGYLGGHRR